MPEVLFFRRGGEQEAFLVGKKKLLHPRELRVGLDGEIVTTISE